jgi:chromosome segregation ATPase
MLKKIAIAAVAIGAGFFILNSTHLGAYAKTAWQKVRCHAQKQVPLEFQLETIRNEAAQLMPDMRKHISAIAAETVTVQNLRDEIADIRGNLEKQKEKVRTMNSELQNAEAKVSLSNRPQYISRLSEKVGRELAAAKRCADELAAKESLLEAKEKALDTAREQLTSMRAQKEQLEVQIAQLEAELKTLRLAQTRSNFQLDDSRLARIKGALAEVRNQMRGQAIEADMVAAFQNDGAPVQKSVAKTAAEVSREVEEFLGESGKSGDKVVTKP